MTSVLPTASTQTVPYIRNVVLLHTVTWTGVPRGRVCDNTVAVMEALRLRRYDAQCNAANRT